MFVSVDADGIVTQIAYNDSSVNDASKLNQYKSWSDVSPRAGRPRFVPQAGSAYVGVALRQHPQPIGPPVPAVVDILPGSPASRSGLRIGDLIVKVDDQSIASTDPDAFVKRISAFPPGKVVTLTIWRGNDWPPRPQQIRFTLGSRPSPQ
ncbi:MAG TPA: PDZ domain-containing protein [Tepidisphaeraceae bacterium]|nr:PDZ domain-containing protein [Tepidisphaeraceae bacterium]